MNSQTPIGLSSISLSGKVALIHSGSPEWTAVIASALGHAGATVAQVSHSRDMASAEQEVQRLVRQHRRIDILVNAPQSGSFAPVSDLTDRALSEAFERNVSSALRITRAAGMQMASAGSGRIITLISGLSRRGLANGVPFTMTQAALDAMTMSLALEWAGKGVRVNGIGYGWYETDRRPIDEQQKDRLVRFLPLRRKGHPDDCMGLLVYLASDASDFVTGQTIFIDGGAMAHA